MLITTHHDRPGVVGKVGTWQGRVLILPACSWAANLSEAKR